MPTTWSTPLTTKSTHKATGSHVDGQGTIETAENGPKLLLHGDWRGLRWPLAARFTAETPQIFSSPAGTVSPRGLLALRASPASGDLFIPQLDPMTVAMRGALHKDHLQIDELDLGAFGGSALLAGDARWTPDESWALEGDVQGFNPAELRPGFNGALDFNHEGERRAVWRRRQSRLRVQQSLRQAARQHARAAAAASSLQGEDWTFEHVALPRRHHQPGHRRRHRRVARAQPRFQPRRRQPRACWPKVRAASCTPTATSAARPDAPVIKLSAQGSGIETRAMCSVDKLAANIDLDWRGQRASHADIAISRPDDR